MLTANTSKRRMSTSRARATIGQAVLAPTPIIVGAQMAEEITATRTLKPSESRASKEAVTAIAMMTAHTTVEAMTMDVSIESTPVMMYAQAAFKRAHALTTIPQFWVLTLQSSPGAAPLSFF
jgi:hypothetical protein